MPFSEKQVKITRSLRVFLCYAPKDKSAVRLLAQHLEADGFDPWLDEDKLLPGQHWQHEITTAVRQSDIVLVCLSRKSVSKQGRVQKEIELALDVAEEKPEDTIFSIPLKSQRMWSWSRISKSLRQVQWLDSLSQHHFRS